MKKMNFDEFTKKVVETLPEYLPEKYTDAEVVLETVSKNNDLKLIGVKIRATNKDYAPIIYLEKYYEDYLNGLELEEISKEIVTVLQEHEWDESIDLKILTVYDQCKDKILPKVISAKYNQDTLKEHPHVLIEDLAVIFFLDLGENKHGYMSINIHHNFLKWWGVDTESLYRISIKNLEQRNVATFCSIKEKINELALYEEMDVCFDLGPKIYVLTNQNTLNGANQILNRNVMKRIIDKVGMDFYLLPSSIHEWLVIVSDYNELDPEGLKFMVKSVNQTLEQNEILSDNVYLYTAEDGLKIV